MSKLLEAHRKLVQSTRNSPAIGFGSAVAGAFALFGLVGWRLDIFFKTNYACTLAGTGLAFLYTFYELMKLVRGLQARIDAENQNAVPKPDIAKDDNPDLSA